MIKRNLSDIKIRIASVCARAGRNPQEITLVAVSKGRTVRQIKEVIAEGVTDIGENRVQEALLKYDAIPACPAGRHTAQDARQVRWHMLGHLQTNKVKEAVKLFDLIQSVDGLRLAVEINRQSEKLKKIQDVLVEVNISADASKFGIKPQQAEGVIKEMAEFKNLNIKGLMGIAPIVDDPEKTRPYFKMLRDLLTKIYPVRSYRATQEKEGVCNGAGAPLILSMGMSNDFEIAIEEGANMLRLGRIVFEG